MQRSTRSPGYLLPTSQRDCETIGVAWWRGTVGSYRRIRRRTPCTEGVRSRVIAPNQPSTSSNKGEFGSVPQHNQLLFLVADADQVGLLVEVAQRYVTIKRIVTDSDRMGVFITDLKGKNGPRGS